MIETCFQVLPGRGQVRALRAALRPPWNASSLLIGRHQAAALFYPLALVVALPVESFGHVFTPIFRSAERTRDIGVQGGGGFEAPITLNRISRDCSR